MTTDKKSDQTTTTINDNKAVFGPLGTYAVVAVIMVSIIVTTAIMLDKELNTVEAKIAAIESGVTDIHSDDTKNIATQETVDAPTVIIADAAESIVAEETAKIEIVPIAEPVTEQIVETPSAEVLVAVEETPVSSQKEKQVANLATTESEIPAQTDQTQSELENQARIEAYKLEQKQHMAEMFARIKLLESQQLDQYKTNQDEQITRLRNHLVSQQQMIDKLILRNKELFELRAANVQRVQHNREQALNRI